MIKVTVTDPTVRHMSGNSKATGKAYDMHFQWVWLHLFNRAGQPDPYPTKVEVILDKDPKDGAALFYAPGEYVLHPSSIYVADGKLAVAPRLVRAAAPAKQAA
ncbi:single-stranded DNA-binding protein [Variovorax sp. PBL-E5]|uniref:single-stranded DNA-binding protein n=1 Tax=Variovorax sp. PBL-E5 TaxID=434014 RepID=UPI0013161CB4|nr:single-stranded DNA-binding protein [Variovorax sp. PBL-E5]VTU36364.1 hypothetical protein E5CHR_04299 [Variovorax sp. PBL-E5]